MSVMDAAPRAVELSVRLWFAVAVLVVLNQVVTLIQGGGIGLPVLVLAAIIVVGAVLMRAGRNWARILTAVAGCVLGLLLLLAVVGFATLLPRLGELPGATAGLLIVTMLLLVIVLAMIVAALVLMFRPAANGYFASEPAAS
jgi:hypothetical protein